MFKNEFAAIDFSTAATQTLVAARPGKRIAVIGYLVDNGVVTAQSVQFRSGATNLTGVMQLPNSVGGVINDNAGASDFVLFYTDIGAALTMVQSAATQVGGYVDFQAI